MRILSHRGFWCSPAEKNSEVAFRRSFENRFGSEIDIRDCAGELLVSHDPPSGVELSLRRLLVLYVEIGCEVTLALNVKADGLQDSAVALLDEFCVTDHFFFDMSVPDMRGYLEQGLPVFTRHSDIETLPVFYKQATGVWLDSLLEEWIEQRVLERHLSADKLVCIVSPELHGREYLSFWRKLRTLPAIDHPRLMLCTDFPREAQQLFG